MGAIKMINGNKTLASKNDDRWFYSYMPFKLGQANLG